MRAVVRHFGRADAGMALQSADLKSDSSRAEEKLFPDSQSEQFTKCGVLQATLIYIKASKLSFCQPFSPLLALRAILFDLRDD